MDGCTRGMTSLPCSLPCIRGYEERRGVDGEMLAGRGGSGTPLATDRTQPLDQWSLDSILCVCGGVWGSCVWTSNTYGGTKVCVCKLYLSVCVCVCTCGMECKARKVTTFTLSNLTSPRFLFLPLSNGLFWRWPWQAMVWILIYVPVKLKSKIPSTAALWQLGWWMVQSLGQTKPLCLCPTF